MNSTKISTLCCIAHIVTLVFTYLGGDKLVLSVSHDLRTKKISNFPSD